MKGSFQTGVGMIAHLMNYIAGMIAHLVNYIMQLKRPVKFTEVLELRADVDKYATRAYENIKDASDKALLSNNELNEQIERLVSNQGENERELVINEDQIERLRANIAENERQLLILQDESQKAERSFHEAQESLKKVEHELVGRREERERVRNAAIGVSFIPFAGWVLGPILAIVSETALTTGIDAAQDICNTASANVSRQQQRVNDTSKSIDDSKRQLKVTEAEKDEQSATKKELKQTIDGLRKRYTTQSKVSEQLRKCAGIMAIAADRSEVLHDQVQYPLNPQAILVPLRELTKLLNSSNFSKSCLEYDNGDLDQLATNLKMIADADSCRTRENVVGLRKGIVTIVLHDFVNCCNSLFRHRHSFI